MQAINLIEYYGGYDQAKEVLSEAKKGIDPIVYVNGEEVLIDFLTDQMLEYRRQNKIYQSCDKVVYVDGINDNDVYTVKENHGNFVVGDNGGNRGFWTLFIEEIRHATDAEIEANRRLDLPESVILSLREVS